MGFHLSTLSKWIYSLLNINTLPFKKLDIEMIPISKCHFKLMFSAERTDTLQVPCVMGHTYLLPFTPFLHLTTQSSCHMPPCFWLVPTLRGRSLPPQLPNSYTFPSRCSPISRAVNIKLLRSTVPTPACMIAEGKFPSISTASFKWETSWEIVPSNCQIKSM